MFHSSSVSLSFQFFVLFIWKFWKGEKNWKKKNRVSFSTSWLVNLNQLVFQFFHLKVTKNNIFLIWLQNCKQKNSVSTASLRIQTFCEHTEFFFELTLKEIFDNSLLLLFILSQKIGKKMKKISKNFLCFNYSLKIEAKKILTLEFTAIALNVQFVLKTLFYLIEKDPYLNKELEVHILRL